MAEAPRGLYATHNAMVLNSLLPGDRIQIPRDYYSHWALYIGGGKVIHLSSSGKGSKHSLSSSGAMFDDGEVRIDNFWDVVGDSEANKPDDCDQAFDSPVIVRRAKNRLGEKCYDPFFSNCEHFVNWCRYGKAKSYQADTVLTYTAIGAGVGVLVGGVMGGLTACDDNTNTNRQPEIATVLTAVAKGAVIGGGAGGVGGAFLGMAEVAAKSNVN